MTGWRRMAMLATVFLVGAMVIAAYFHNEFRSQNWDPQQTRVYVDRTIRFGGTFYENGLVNKGPFEPMVYRIAAAITSWDGFWYAISAFILIACGLLAWAASSTTRFVGGHRVLGVAVGIVVFYHFALGKADYAGVLYSRNMIIALFAGAWIIALSARCWFPRRAPWAAAAVGILIGLGVQTLFVSGIAAFGVFLAAWSTVETVEDPALYHRCRRILLTSPIATFLAAPAYYLMRGRIAEFWSSYWTYNTYQNAAAGRSLANQLVYGRDAILRYYRAWPFSFVIVLAFVVVTAALWSTFSRRERSVHIALSVWTIGAWTEIVLSQRYSSHYFSVLALPTSLMAATVIGHVYALVRRERQREFRTIAAWPLIAGLLAVAAWGGTQFNLGLQAASGYTNVHAAADQRRVTEPGRQRTVRAILDLVSDEGDPLLAWTEYPWTYLNNHRVAATRWIWKSFMLGQIYLGRASPNYVLPRTWEWFAEDMREARPAAFLEEVALPVTQGTPFADYVNANFEPVYVGADTIVHLRHDRADAVLNGDRGEVFERSKSLTAGDLFVLGAPCTRVSGTYIVEPSESGSFLSFVFSDSGGAAQNARLNVVGNDVFSGNDTAVFDSVMLDEGVGEHEFAVVSGKRSAALVIDGEIRAAVRLDGHDQLALEVRTGDVTLTDLRRGSAPPDSGC